MSSPAAFDLAGKATDSAREQDFDAGALISKSAEYRVAPRSLCRRPDRIMTEMQAEHIITSAHIFYDAAFDATAPHTRHAN